MDAVMSPRRITYMKEVNGVEEDSVNEVNQPSTSRQGGNAPSSSRSAGRAGGRGSRNSGGSRGRGQGRGVDNTNRHHPY